MVVGFKYLWRRLPMKKFQNFQELLAAGWNYIKNVCKFNKLHIVFDSYFADSLKECERETCELVNLYILIVYLQVSSQPERFWSCGENKKNLKRLSRTFFHKY